jgi:hypothetical protein
MHLEFQPSDEPDPDAQFSVPPEQITTELLGLCAEFFRRASPNVHSELRQFLTEHGYQRGGLGWFIDTLGFTTLNTTALDNKQPGAPQRVHPAVVEARQQRLVLAKIVTALGLPKGVVGEVEVAAS